MICASAFNAWKKQRQNAERNRMEASYSRKLFWGFKDPYVNLDFKLSSSRAALRPPGPLRTGRESFPSPSSSPSNASLKETRFRNEKTLTMNLVMALGMK
jgi:hypothetical protein